MYYPKRHQHYIDKLNRMTSNIGEDSCNNPTWIEYMIASFMNSYYSCLYEENYYDALNYINEAIKFDLKLFKLKHC